VSAAAAAVVRLKRTLHDDSELFPGSFETFSGRLAASELSIVVKQIRACQRTGVPRDGLARVWYFERPTGSSHYRDPAVTQPHEVVCTRVFHNCGKNCGKPARVIVLLRSEADFSGISRWRKRLCAVLRASIRCYRYDAAVNTRACWGESSTLTGFPAKNAAQ
jgi:hypothetical protein